MKKIACLIAIMMMLFPSLALSQRKLDPSTRSRAQNAKWDRLAARLVLLQEVSKPLRKFYSDLLKIDFDNSPMATDVLARMLPSYTAYLKQEILKKYGVDISFVFTAKMGAKPDGPDWLPPQLKPLAPFIRVGSAVVAGYVLIDKLSEGYIIRDLQQSGFTHDQAVAAAEYITNEGHIEAGRFLDSLCTPALASCDRQFEDFAYFLNALEEITNARDYDPNDYDPNEGFIPSGMKPHGFRSFPDDGGSVTGRFLGTPGPGQGGGQNPNVSLGCWIYGPIYVDPVTGVVVEGWYTIPC